MGSRTAQRVGAAVAAANPAQHYIVIRSGAREGGRGRVAEEMKPGGRESAEGREESI